MRFGKDTRKQANDLISALYKVLPEGNHLALIDVYCRMVRLAKSHHTIQEHECNGTKTKRMESRERNIELDLTVLAQSVGLRVEFGGDPRGYTVKLHAPGNKLYNTWGGPETGYGIG